MEKTIRFLDESAVSDEHSNKDFRSKSFKDLSTKYYYISQVNLISECYTYIYLESNVPHDLVADVNVNVFKAGEYIRS